jgi:hypothetical protein
MKSFRARYQSKTISSADQSRRFAIQNVTPPLSIEEQTAYGYIGSFMRVKAAAGLQQGPQPTQAIFERASQIHIQEG